MNTIPNSKKVNTADLQRIFDDKSECYKLFWFKAILTEVRLGKQKITYNELLCHMMADAYYMVNAFHLNLGPNDSLEKIVRIIQEQTQLVSNVKPDKLYRLLLDYRAPEITKLRSNLINDVPYCIQSPFLHNTSISRLPSGKTERIDELNRLYQEQRLFYYYSAYKQYDTEVIIDDDWFEYLAENIDVLEGWVQYKLINYLQKRNPRQMGIPNKLVPPQKRELNAAKDFWTAVISRNEIYDCYTGKQLTKDNFEKYGRMEIDHFIPWTYVTSDEIWNLTPTFQRVNGSKNDGLPNMEVDFKRMAYQHHNAFGAASENSDLRKLLKKYMDKNLNDVSLINMYRGMMSDTEYESKLWDVVHPIYEQAENAGYKPWSYKE